MKKIILILILIICFSLNKLKAQIHNELFIEYKTLIKTKDSLEKVNNLSWRDYDYFTLLLTPFVKPNQLPEYLLQYPILKTEKDTNELMNGWLNSSFELIRNLANNKSCTLFIDSKTKNLLNHTIIENDTLGLTYGENYVLKSRESFSKALQIISKSEQNKLIENTKNYLAEIKKIKSLYEKKYLNDYRNRNILEYFIDGGINGWIDKKQQRRGMLTPPNRYASILLSNPILAISSNNLGKIDSKSGLYSVIQLIGIDIFSKNFESHSGLSVFHAFSVSDDKGIWENSLIGVEIHYKNKFNLGYGVHYKNFDPDDELGKFFISYALFQKYLKQRNK